MPGAGSRKRRALDIACTALLIVGALRLFALVLHVPLLGYANQYDMARSSACVDLWPALPRPARYAAHQSAPIAYYAVEHLDHGPCYPSSVLVFVELGKGGVAILREAGLMHDATFPLEAVGLAEALALVALVLAFMAAERARPHARLTHATLFAVVLADPAMSLWMNTLYTEFAAAFFLYAVGGLLALAPGPPPPLSASARYRSAASAVVWTAAFIGLAWSRQQYAIFAVAALLIAAPQALRHARLRWIACVLAVGASVGIQSLFVAGLPAVRAANNHDFFLGAALPAARDEVRALDRLGLPADCRDAVGSNWYVGMGSAPEHECSEVDTLGRLSFLHLLPGDPTLPARILVRGLPLAQPWWQHYLGTVAGARFGDWSHASSPLAWSLADPIERLPLAGFLGILAALTATFVAAAAAWMCGAIRGSTGDGWTRAMLYTSAAGVYAPVSAIFGDGYVEVSRHAIVLHPALAALAILAAGRGVVLLRRHRAAEHGSARWISAARIAATRIAATPIAAAWLAAAWIATAWIATTLLLTVTLVLCARNWPLGQGVVDLPATRTLDGNNYSMRGWAVDPRGVRSVRVEAFRNWDTTVPERTWTVVPGHPVRGPQGESLSIYYPTYPDTDRAGFAVDIPRAAWPANAPCLRTSVENRLGVATEIDRRCVTR